MSAFVMSLAFAGSCGNGGASSDQLGTVGFQLQVAAGVTINTVGWSITNTGTGFARTGNVSVQASNTIAFQQGGLPAGAGYVVALSAVSVDGTLGCAGSAPFAVTAGSTAGVAVALTCTSTAPGAGSVLVTGTTVICGGIAGISAAPLESAVGSTIALSASASGSAPTFAWTATGGAFDNAASATPVFTCPATPGTVTITVTSGPSDPACATVDSASVAVTCDTLAPTFTNVYANVIGARCTSCHKPGSSGVTAGMLDLSTPVVAYASLVGVSAAGTSAGSAGATCASRAPALLRVSPGDATDSLLYNKVQAKLAGTMPACGSTMPLGSSAAPLTQAQIDLIAGWIDAGALDN